MAVFGFGRRNAVGRQYNGGNVSVMLPRYTTPPERNTRDWLEMEGCMMARMFKPPKSAPRPAENKAVHAKERKTAATPPADSQEAPEKGAQ